MFSLLQIGSSPGFEDGDFESAKLRRPAGSYYHATEDCLYFVDSEVCIWMCILITIRFLPRFINVVINHLKRRNSYYAKLKKNLFNNKRKKKLQREFSMNSLSLTSVLSKGFVSLCFL